MRRFVIRVLGLPRYLALTRMRCGVLGHLAKCSTQGLSLAIGSGLLLSALLLILLNSSMLAALAHDRAVPIETLKGLGTPAEGATLGDENTQLFVYREAFGSTDLARNADWRGSFQPSEPKIKRRIQLVVYTVYAERKVNTQVLAPLPIMRIELHTYSTSAAYRVELRLGVRKNLVESQRWEEVEWWKSGDLASSPALIEILPCSWPTPFLYEIRFPTSYPALVSWLKTEWNRVSRKRSPHYVDEFAIEQPIIRQSLAGEVERVLAADARGLELSIPAACIRITNGSIQWLTIASFVSLLIILWARSRMFVSIEHRNLEREARMLSRLRVGHQRDWWLQALSPTKCHRDQHATLFGCQSASLTIVVAGLNALRPKADTGDVPPLIDSATVLEQGRLESRSNVPRFLLAAMPGLGFLGTVIGIGNALMGTGAVLADSLGKQQSGVGGVSLQLSFAFDTTLVALLLSLIASFLMSKLSSDEEEAIAEAKRFTLGMLVDEFQTETDRLLERNRVAFARREFVRTTATDSATQRIDAPDDYKQSIPRAWLCSLSTLVRVGVGACIGAFVLTGALWLLRFVASESGH